MRFLLYRRELKRRTPRLDDNTDNGRRHEWQNLYITEPPVGIFLVTKKRAQNTCKIKRTEALYNLLTFQNAAVNKTAGVKYLFYYLVFSQPEAS